jgi:predicted NACHT family NTPase
MINFEHKIGKLKFEKNFEKNGSFNNVKACKISITKLNTWVKLLRNTEYVLSKICLESRIVDSLEDLEFILLKWRRFVRQEIKKTKNKKDIFVKNIIVNESKGSNDKRG